ncbi:M20 metallopeptidase family protein [Leucobacter sp. UCMA 4100]|uniref:M20 metallopeptidase family protein n=1 Tax=Leucobacter sp. UCMA 4100 TaxID=2810534 RepID=UPI0022EB3203|nr:M20 family metallopeptidase [Leucobacter sp. UCMA 4100]
MDFVARSLELDGALRALRRDLHQIPEQGLSLPLTQQRLLQELEGLPIEVTLGESLSSITAVIRGTAGEKAGATATPTPAPAVLLRSDMDALPVVEETGLDFVNPDATNMHACGHDLHMTMLVGALKLLAEHRDELAGDVVCVFQPGEEGFDGAQHMLDEGLLEITGAKPVAAYALHVFSSHIESGRFLVRQGAIMSASDTVRMVVRGHGGHGSAPHQAIDPITASAAMVSALQTMVTRRFDAFDPVVLSFGMFRGGSTENVIPESVEMLATVRTFSEKNRELMRSEVVKVLEGVADAHSVTIDIDYEMLYPVTKNDADEADFVAGTVAELFGDESLERPKQPLSASEDFSKMLEHVPGVFIPLGATPEGVDLETGPYNHAAGAQFDEAVLTRGAALLATLAARRLNPPA